jgi:hypothetical protein
VTRLNEDVGPPAQTRFRRSTIAQTRVESAAGTVAVGEGVAVAGGFRLNAGASVSTVAPFPTAAHRTGLANFPRRGPSEW